eukprot:2909573-Lingulodinium_polyedra.AAC.1
MDQGVSGGSPRKSGRWLQELLAFMLKFTKGPLRSRLWLARAPRSQAGRQSPGLNCRASSWLAGPQQAVQLLQIAPMQCQG